LFENLAAEYAYEKQWLFLKIYLNFTTLFHNSCGKWEKEQRNKKKTWGGGGSLCNEERKEGDCGERGHCIKKSLIPTLRIQRSLPEKFTHLLNFCPSISASRKMF